MRGHTLIELLFVVTLAAVTASALLPAVGRLRDRAAVAAAREAAVGMLSRARAGAMEAGAGSARFGESPAHALVRIRDSLVATVDLSEEFGVGLALPAESLVVRYDALGLGRMASGSVRFERGTARSGIVISAYGRVRRQ